VFLVSLESGEERLLIESGYDARYVPSGHLIFARSGNLLAAAFDLERLQVVGDPAPVVSNVSMQSVFPQMQAVTSGSGVLVYVSGGDRSLGRLAWVDRRGDTEFLPVPERIYGALDLAPGGMRLAVQVMEVTDYIWIYDIDRDEGRKLTAPGNAGWPVWTPDGKSVTFTSWRSGERRILERSADGSGTPVELASAGRASSWSPDGQVLALAPCRFLRRDGRPGPEWQEPAGSMWGMPAFSTNGRWIAYNSTESGRSEVWVRSYPDGKIARQISVQGGLEPVWCQDCGQLFYRRGNQWMSSAVVLEPQLTWTPPSLAFETDFVDTAGVSYDVSPDGQRLLVVKSTHEPTRTKLYVVNNWFRELNAKLARASPAADAESP
jgi:hypothetical protein